jgi:hypothetical protein
MWQDILLGLANWILVLSLMPTVLSRTEKPAFLSSILTGTCLLGIALSYYTLGLLMGAIPAALNGAQWFILAYQRQRLNRKSGEPLFAFWK